MIIELPDKTYNKSTLQDDLSAEPKFQIWKSADDTFYAVMEDDSLQTNIDNVTALAIAHDPSPTDEQLANIDLSEIAGNKDMYYVIMPLARQIGITFEDGWVANDDFETINTALFTVYNNATVEQKAFVRRVGRSFNVDIQDIVNTPDIDRTTQMKEQFTDIMWKVSFMTIVRLRM